MGTRADFYIGTDKNAEWLGSIAWDGYPEGIPPILFTATNEADFRLGVKAFLDGREDATFPDVGWPWPWDTSDTTDYAYALHEGKVLGSCFGKPFFDPTVEQQDDEEHEEPGKHSPDWPNMADRKNVTFGKRSGVMFIGG